MFAAGELSNRRAPGFSIVDVNQQQHDLADYRGKYVLLDFMQTGCPHCIKFAEILEKLSIQYRGKVEAISIVLPPDNIQTVRTYIKTHNVTIPVLFDSGQVTASYLRLTPATPRIYFPHLFIVNPAGRIVNDWGYTSDGKADDIFSGDGLAKELERLLGGKK
jgi:peroxiredoxin